jgi:hypothetical protein
MEPVGQTRAALQAASSSAAPDGWRAKRTRSPSQTINSGATLTDAPHPMQRSSTRQSRRSSAFSIVIAFPTLTLIKTRLGGGASMGQLDIVSHSRNRTIRHP